MLNDILENRAITELVRNFDRSPLQLNQVHTSDAELLSIPSPGAGRIAVTTDTVAEEIHSGLYRDPWLIGWMTVMVNVSDLAAVAATPLGLLIAQTLPPDLPEAYIRSLQTGINDACRACGTFVLGGDTNSGRDLSLTACALGLLQGDRLLSRRGGSPGDVAFVSGPVGDGSAYAFASRTGAPLPAYRPFARTAYGDVLRRHATSCMDTSDGLLSSLDQLMRVNGRGFTLDADWVRSLSPAALTLAAHLGIPPWVVIAGEHGEFELLFTVPEIDVAAFENDAAAIGWEPMRIGTVISSPEVLVPRDISPLRLDTTAVRNCADLGRTDMHAYIKALLAIERSRGNSTRS